MKKVNILLLVLMAVLLGSCNKQRMIRHQIEKAVEKINEQCPIKGVFGEVTNVALEDNTLVYNLDVKTNLIQLDKLKSNVDLVKESILFDIVSNPDGFKSIVSSNCDLKYNYKSGNDMLTVVVKADELKKASTLLHNPDEVNRKRLEMLVKTTKLQTPMQVDEVTLLKDMFIEGKKVCYLYDIDNEKLTSDMMTDDIDGFKESIKSSFNVNDPSIAGFLDAIIDNQMSLSYRYDFPEEKKTVEVNIDYDELMDIAVK